MSKVLVCIRRFILASDGWGMLYPTNSTSALPLSTTRKRLPKVWSSLLKTYVAQRISLGYYGVKRKLYLMNDQFLLKLGFVVAVVLTHARDFRGHLLLVLFGHVAVVIALGHFLMGMLLISLCGVIIIFICSTFCLLIYFGCRLLYNFCMK